MGYGDRFPINPIYVPYHIYKIKPADRGRYLAYCGSDDGVMHIPRHEHLDGAWRVARRLADDQGWLSFSLPCFPTFHFSKDKQVIMDCDSKIEQFKAEYRLNPPNAYNVVLNWCGRNALDPRISLHHMQAGDDFKEMIAIAIEDFNRRPHRLTVYNGRLTNRFGRVFRTGDDLSKVNTRYVMANVTLTYLGYGFVDTQAVLISEGASE